MTAKNVSNLPASVHGDVVTLTIDVEPIAFTSEFTDQASTVAQWTAFRGKLPNTECPETLTEVVPLLVRFVLPIARACAAGETFEQRWPPGGPWTAEQPGS